MNRIACIAGSSMLALALTGCATSPAPSVASNPARGVRELQEGDADLLSISMAAGAELKTRADRGPISFLGVIVDGRPQKTITDSLIKAYGFIRVNEGARQPYAVVVNGPSGGRAPSPSTGGAMSGQAVYAFTMFRATIDTAYVGAGIPSAAGPTGAMMRPEAPALCIVLAKPQGTWVAVRRAEIRQPEDCGR